MKRTLGRLSATAIVRLTKRGRYADGGGLVLQVSEGGSRSWLFRWERDGRERQMGLGATHTLSLAEAREVARECRRIVLTGGDPIEQREAERAQRRVERARGGTFREAAERYLAAHEKTWKNVKHREQWRSTLASYVLPNLGDLPLSAIDTALVLKCLEPIWSSKPETASRVRGRIETVLDWATARGLRQGENPARWRGHLDKILPRRSQVRAVEHHAALPYAELPAFMGELRARDSISARALEFAILTATRTGETIGARWDEFDLAQRMWTIPAERMKARREHRVPLSGRALAVLAALPRERGNLFVFIGLSAGKPLSNMAMLELLRGVRPGYVPHGFRSTFRDWAADRTNHQNHVVEAALAHVVRDKVEVAYRRGDLFDKRRRLMDAWSNYCASEKVSDSAVVTFEQRAAHK
jgi:integrase